MLSFNAVWGIYKLYDSIYNLTNFFQNNYFTHFAGKADFDKIKSLHQYN